jgi:hypothetical protein
MDAGNCYNMRLNAENMFSNGNEFSVRYGRISLHLISVAHKADLTCTSKRTKNCTDSMNTIYVSLITSCQTHSQLKPFVFQDYSPLVGHVVA